MILRRMLFAMRIVYFGSGAFGLPTLERLASRHTIAMVVTQPDKPAGRGGKVSATPIGQWAAAHLPSVPIIKPAKVREEGVVAQIRAVEADAWVVIAFGQKLPAGLLADRFAINLHASLLPRWRGAAPINAAILGGDAVTGNTVITLADRMDAGLILGQTERAIPASMTAGELHDLLAQDGPELVERVLAEHMAGTLKGRAQDESLVTIAGKLSKDNDAIDFAMPAEFLCREVHALTPWPGITVAAMAGGERRDGADAGGPLFTFKILRVAMAERVSDDPNRPEGLILDAARGLVACGHGSVLRVLEVQPPGKRAMGWADFVRGGGRVLAQKVAKLVAAREVLDVPRPQAGG
ncbi:MAG: methionyl-tRNA formyltransferase [Phycisphaerales bacterium]|nr:methionyl-tRNA formyltransferase [Phycisphaerales bacterium]